MLKQVIVNFYIATFITGFVFSSALSLANPESNNSEENLIKPYEATYTINYGSISADLKRSLINVKSAKGENSWQVKNTLSMFLVGFEESSVFKENSNAITPTHYIYDNKIRSNRNSNLTFDWEKLIAEDPAQLKKPLSISTRIKDKLSFQEQLRIDSIRLGAKFLEKNYDIIDTKRIKSYKVKRLSEEKVTTPAGSFKSIKFKKYRPGKNEYTLFWLAKDWDHFILRIDRIDNDQLDYQILLKEGSIGRKTVKGV